MGAVEDLLNEIPRLDKTPRGRPCGVCLLLADLTPTESAALVALLSDKRIRYDQIADGMRRKGVANLDRSIYAYHARGACAAQANLRPKAGK